MTRIHDARIKHVLSYKGAAYNYAPDCPAVAETVATLAAHFDLSDAEREELAGRVQAMWANRPKIWEPF